MSHCSRPLCIIAAAHLAAGTEIRAVAGAAGFGNPPQFLRNKDADLIRIVADLEIGLVEDNRPLEDARILLDELDQLVRCHRIDIDVLFLDDLGALGDDIIRTIFAAHQQMLDFIIIQKNLEDILFNKREIAVFQPLFHFAAGGASRGCVNDDHKTSI